MTEIDPREFAEARRVLAPIIRRTALFETRTFGRWIGGQIFLKPENQQRTGSFKIRGAAYMLSRLGARERAAGVVAASAGNHAQGVAVAAQELGVPATIVMPETAPVAKVAATKGYGARVVLHGSGYAEAAECAAQLAATEGLTPVPAFDHPAVIAGQGTIGLEILDELPDVDTIVCSVGGGGLIAGIACAVKARRPVVRVIGVQAAAAPAALMAWRMGTVQAVPPLTTIADGIAVARPGQITMPLIRAHVDDMVAVDDQAISQAIVLLLERCKLVVEGAGAAPLAALLSGLVPRLRGQTAVVLSGGNIDLNLIDRIVQQGLMAAGRYMLIRTRLTDRPGQLHQLLSVIAETRANVVDIVHRRASPGLPVTEAEIDLVLEVRDLEHTAQVRQHLAGAGYVLQRTDEAASPLAP